MKKILLALTLLAQLPALAQPKFYIQPTVSVGISNVNFSIDPPLPPLEYSPALGYAAGIQAGMQISRLRIGTGVEYMHLTADYSSVSSPTFTDEFDHILIPLNAGIVIPLGGKLSVVPTAGAALSINSGLNTRPLKSTSIWGQVRADLEYALNKRISITGGPRFSYMLTSMVEHTPFSIGNTKAYNYALMFSGGVLVQL